jgi:hypothetical protein
MNFRKFAVLSCVLAVATGAVFAGINSKEVGAVLIYPEYRAETGSKDVDTYISVTNDKSTDVIAHVEVIGDGVCDDCNFDLPLTGFQTKRLRFNREYVGSGDYATVIYDASVHSNPNSPSGYPSILTACPERRGFVVITLEEAGSSPRLTLGENMLHGDAVIVEVSSGTSSQMGAIAIQGVGMNDGDRNLRFDNMEYAAFPSIVTANFWAPNSVVEPRLILFNVNFQTGQWPAPVTHCALNYVNAEEVVFSRNLSFDCWEKLDLRDIAPGFIEDILGTANGFLWAECDAGTHGAMVTDLEGSTPNYPYPRESEHRDTLFQSVTINAGAELRLTPSITGGGGGGN